MLGIIITNIGAVIIFIVATNVIYHHYHYHHRRRRHCQSRLPLLVKASKLNYEIMT